ncbi:PREDICTED: uncharacterized protein LOC100635769 [Amphimedon queenslandica]|uniref:CAP-Gly domain-containing protein n=1 Tax=Amphimedon queenslandica TaxID=400682 RepID=A0AAN0IXH7_AMPQE|nr:PREDICTED: uncharacterized protein LOC100635769 [Amphimedon queenslandica]|eukprot:XP_019849470.1 PREDICTED: uncharacterized protein LOC100635769 [Amphimedon queenslandica]
MAANWARSSGRSSISVSILLKDKAGFHFKDDGGAPWQCTVPKGELVIEQPKEEIPSIESDKLPPNYRLYRDDEYVVLHCRAMDVCPLGDREMEYLLAVESLSTRLQEYLKPEEVKKEKLDLVVGDMVMFKLKVKPDAFVSIVKGVIRYIGPIQEKHGTHFGIEIQEERYRGKGTSNGDPYFCCGSKDAVFVSMNMITKKSQYPMDEKHALAKSAITGQPISKNRNGGSSDISQGPFYARTDPNHKSKFKINDRVVVKSAKDEVFNGTVKWVGTTRVFNEGNRYSSVVAAVGVDVEKAFLSTDKHFPGMYIDVTGSRGQELFKVPLSHTRLFFPEEYGVVLHAEEYAKQQQEANALKWEMKEAKKFGLSLEEYQSQREYLEKANKDKKTHHPQQTGGGQEEEGAVAGVGAFKKNENEKDKMSESMMHIKPGVSLSEGRRQQEERAFQLARQRSQHGGGDQTGFEVIKGEVKPVGEGHQQSVNPVPEGLQRPSPKAHHEAGYTSLSSSDSKYYQRHSPGTNQYSPDPAGQHDDRHSYLPGGSSDNYQPGGSSNQYSSGGPPPDPYHQFTIGSMVYIDTQKGDPLYGVVQWIGTLPDFPGTIAGVELEKTMNGGTDGTWRGRRFFTCPPGKAYFCPVNTLKQDTRYMDEGQVPAHMRQDIDNRMLIQFKCILCKF